MTLSDVEIILPSGKFASIAAPTFGDILACGLLDGKGLGHALLGLCTLCVRIDGKALSVDDWEQTSYQEIEPIIAPLMALVTKGKRP